MSSKNTITTLFLIIMLGFSLLLITTKPLCAQTREVVVVYFEPDTEGIGPGNKQKVKDMVNELKNTSEYTIQLEGYSDITGRADYNLRLSRERAELVKEYLLQLGVDAEKIEVIGKGGTDKYASGETDDALARNRRVNVIFEIAPEPEKNEETPEEIILSQIELQEPVVDTETEEAEEEIIEPQVLELSNISEKIDRAIRQSAPKGIVFTTPSEMKIGSSYIAEAQVSYDFIDALSKDLAGFRLGDQIGLELTASGLDISDGALDVKKIERNSPSKWQWQIMPQTQGLKSLILTVAISSENAVLNDKYPTFNRVIDVKSNLIHSVTSSYWVMGVLIVFIVVLVAWILTRRVKVN